jgi:hypothetical protein
MIISMLTDPSLMNETNFAEGYNVLTGDVSLNHPSNQRYGGVHTDDSWIKAKKSHCKEKDSMLGGPELKYLSTAPFFPIFGLTAILKILSFQALALGDNIANLLQCWHQQLVLQIVTFAHSPACDSGSSTEMLRRSHWKTQIEGLTKR